MRPFTATFLGATTLLTAAAQAATVTITDCGASPVEKIGTRTVISRPADDVTIQCALRPLPGTTRIDITAHSLVADGAAGGSIVAAGEGLAIDIRAAVPAVRSRSTAADSRRTRSDRATQLASRDARR
jgi:hypothetical protein